MSAAADNDSWVLVDNENSPTADQPQELTIQNDQEEQMADNPQQIIDESDSNNQPQLVSNPDGSTQNECITAWEPIRLRQEWNIQNFARVMELSSPGVCMRSYKFMDDSMQDIDWQLCLYPGGKREENIGNVSLFLRMSTFVYAQKDFTVRAEYRFYFVDDTGIAKFSNVNTGDFKVKPSSKGSHSWGLRNIPRQKVLQSIRQDGSLHIVCEVEILPDFNKLQSHLCQDYRLGLETEPPFIEIRRNRSLTLTEFITIIEERGEVVNLLVYCPNGAGRRRRCVMPVLPWDIDRFSGCGGKLVEDIAYELRQHGKRQSHGIYEFQVFYVNRDAAVDWVQYFF